MLRPIKYLKYTQKTCFLSGQVWLQLFPNTTSPPKKFIQFHLWPITYLFYKTVQPRYFHEMIQNSKNACCVYHVERVDGFGRAIKRLKTQQMDLFNTSLRYLNLVSGWFKKSLTFIYSPYLAILPSKAMWASNGHFTKEWQLNLHSTE